MSGMEDQLGAILGDPVMMQKIQALAQSMGQSQPPGQPEKPERVVQPSPAGPGTGDLGMLKAFTGFLKALSPYVSREKIAKLEKAMRSAKLAQQTSGLLESGALKNLTGG